MTATKSPFRPGSTRKKLRYFSPIAKNHNLIKMSRRKTVLRLFIWQTNTMTRKLFLRFLPQRILSTRRRKQEKQHYTWLQSLAMQRWSHSLLNTALTSDYKTKKEWPQYTLQV